MKIEIIKSDYGYSYQFTLKEPDGTPSDITDSTVTLRARHSEFGDVVEKPMTIINPTAGTVKYELEEGDFTREGVYYAEVVTEVDGDRRATYPGFTLMVIPKV